MAKIEVDRQKYLLMCIDILKSPDGMINNMTQEFAEEEILRLAWRLGSMLVADKGWRSPSCVEMR